jgi:nucleoside-diphosphate-sugar epimerase
MASEDTFPSTLRTEADVDELMARPGPGLVDMMGRLKGDITILGIAGKMGVSLGALAVNAARAAGTDRKVYGVSRFSDPAVVVALERAGITPIRCDLLDRDAVRALPRTPLVLFMAGRKFGTAGEECLTWAMNTVLPAHVCEHYARSRIVAFSTGCVYPLVPLERTGCVEEDRPAPVGEYAQSCLGRERTFEYFSRTNGTPVCLLRLNYALDVRYGVIHDLALAIWEGRPVNRTVGHFNAIWQGDANNQALLALELCSSPPAILNLTGPETVSVTDVAETLGHLLGKAVTYAGDPGPVAYLNNAARAHRLFGPPRVSLAQVINWTAEWVRQGGRSLGKPTHFEVSDGKY